MSWADKYRPRNIDDLILNSEIRKQIIDWIESWKEGIPKKRSLILYGSQGTGKTTTAYAIAGTLGVPVVEMNASDQRNRDSMKSTALMASLYGDLFVDSDKRPSKVILIDEADNMFERGGDTGGIYELSRIIKNSANPIVITMNDIFEFRKKNYASDVVSNSLVIEMKQYARRLDRNYNEFRRNIKARLLFILKNEGYTLPDQVVDRIIDRNMPDIRSMINDLEASAVSGTNISDQSARDVPEIVYYMVDKAFKRNYDETLRSIYGSDIDDSYYVSWIDENLPMKTADMNDLASAYDLISYADHILWAMERRRHYELMAFPMEIAGGVAYYIENMRHEYVKYQSPSYISQMSRTKEKRHNMTSLALKLGLLVHMSAERTMDYLWFYSLIYQKNDTLRNLINDKLNLSQGEESILSDLSSTSK
ncbi:replication factor C large subunit [Thermoplasma sp.]|uniref:replication factor C large subunit n=1 Tax=Thermoplasma sp. TaxID=1973142 RepID=UPI002629C847|nr:replication factor C large subunit [Thermoplasma sp.]